MTLSHSHLSYQPEFDILDAALESDNGVRLPFPTYSAASAYRFRLHHARTVDRKRNTEVYEPGDPLYGTSVYDALVCRIKPRGDKFYIYVERNVVAEGMEPIPLDDFEPSLPKPEPLPQLAPPASSLFRRKF